MTAAMLTQLLMKVCICSLVIQHVTGKRKGSSNKQQSQFDDAEYEFGRQSSSSASSAVRMLEETLQMEDAFRSLLEVDFPLSLSMSMSITPPFPTAHPSAFPSAATTTMPPTLSHEPSESEAPSTVAITERLAAGPCSGDPTRITTIIMEVELAVGNSGTGYTTDLDQALTEALAESFPLCESFARHRQLQENPSADAMHLGEISVTDKGSECETQSSAATTCREAQVVVEEYGGTGQEDIASLIRFIIAENEDLDDDLMKNGILAIRVTDDDDMNVAESNNSVSQSSSSNDGKLAAGTTAVVVVVSLAAVTLIGAAFMRRGSQWRQNGLSYSHTFDEYDDKSIDQTSQADQTYDDTIPFAASVDSVGILGAMSRDSFPSDESPPSFLRKRPSSP